MLCDTSSKLIGWKIGAKTAAAHICKLAINSITFWGGLVCFFCFGFGCCFVFWFFFNMGKYSRATLILTLRVTGNFLPERPKNNYPLERLRDFHSISFFTQRSKLCCPAEFFSIMKVNFRRFKKKRGIPCSCNSRKQRIVAILASLPPLTKCAKSPPKKLGHFGFCLGRLSCSLKRCSVLHGTLTFVMDTLISDKIIEGLVLYIFPRLPQQTSLLYLAQHV